MTRNGDRSIKNGAHDPGPMPLAATFCKLCNAPFPATIPIIGAHPEAAFHRLVGQLAMHLQTKHPERAQIDVAAQIQETMALSACKVLDRFNSTDEDLMIWRDRQRHRVFRAAIRGPVSDDLIILQVYQLFDYCSKRDDGHQTPTIEEVILLLRSMRDAIEERALYPDLDAQPSVLVP